MNNRMGWLAALSFAAVGAYIGCGGGDGGSDDPTPSMGGGDTGGQTGDLEIAFAPMYSGFDGVHTYKVPVKAVGVKNATFTASDPSMVSIVKDGDTSIITTKKAGKVTITGTAGGLKGSTELTITQYQPADWEAGNKRYNEGEAFKIPEYDPCNPKPPTISKRLSCTNCHGITGTLGDVEHTPEQTAGYSDQDLINIFTNATKPAGVAQRIIPLQIWQFFHKWEVTDAEKSGILSYLRALEPKPSNDSTDFGGRFRPGGDGGFQIPRCDGGVSTGTTTTTTSDAGVAGN